MVVNRYCQSKHLILLDVATPTAMYIYMLHVFPFLQKDAMRESTIDLLSFLRALDFVFGIHTPTIHSFIHHFTETTPASDWSFWYYFFLGVLATCRSRLGEPSGTPLNTPFKASFFNLVAICAGVSAGFCSRYRATTPATNGAACEVPSAGAKSVSFRLQAVHQQSQEKTRY